MDKDLVGLLKWSKLSLCLGNQHNVQINSEGQMDGNIGMPHLEVIGPRFFIDCAWKETYNLDEFIIKILHKKVLFWELERQGEVPLRVRITHLCHACFTSQPKNEGGCHDRLHLSGANGLWAYVVTNIFLYTWAISRSVEQFFWISHSLMFHVWRVWKQIYLYGVSGYICTTYRL